MESKRHTWTRRSVLRRTGLAIAGTTLGGASVVGAASAKDCCKVCWMDVKPGCCPNGIDARKNEVFTVYIGWPNVKPESVRLRPSSEKVTFDRPTCQQYRNPKWKNASCSDIEGLLAGTDGRSARPCHVTVRDVDSDGDGDTVMRFNSCALELRHDDRNLVLEAETGSGCRLLAVDSVAPCNCKTANRH